MNFRVFLTYANSQVYVFYVSVPATDYNDAMDRLMSCITNIRDWMARNRLKLNEEKTQIIWLGTRQQLDKITVR